mmetsp:Transcript_56125/g.130674  ORF Transcript_56125/g.130674 Transcript_56125/m.130674 type:complete len:232 (-) Transcript_56125:860-1555(-)
MPPATSSVLPSSVRSSFSGSSTPHKTSSVCPSVLWAAAPSARGSSSARSSPMPPATCSVHPLSKSSSSAALFAATASSVPMSSAPSGCTVTFSVRGSSVPPITSSVSLHSSSLWPVTHHSSMRNLSCLHSSSAQPATCPSSARSAFSVPFAAPCPLGHSHSSVLHAMSSARLSSASSWSSGPWAATSFVCSSSVPPVMSSVGLSSLWLPVPAETCMYLVRACSASTAFDSI